MRKRNWMSVLALVAVLSVPALAAAEGYYASGQTKKYHAEQCRSVKKIKPEQLKTFASKAEAEAAGYVACKRCKP